MAERIEYLQPQALLEDSFRLAAKVHASGFRPTFILAVWRGGAPVGLAVQEYLAYHGVRTDHIAIRTSAYAGVDARAKGVQVYGLSYLVKNLAFEDRLLVVDDVFDTGRTIDAIVTRLRQRLRRNMPHDVRIAVPYYKPARNETRLAPNYYQHETERWLKYPHELDGWNPEDLRRHRPEVYEILSPLLGAAVEDAESRRQPVSSQ